jgi:hypothetical protein
MKPMTERTRLPNRRGHPMLDFDHAGQRYTASVTRFPTGEVAEVFINAAKGGSDIETVARDAAILISIAAQYGVPLEAFRHAITRNREGSPSGLNDDERLERIIGWND